MTEIYMPILMERAFKLKPAKRKELIAAIQQRLHPLTGSHIGMMLKTNNLEAAFRMIARINEKAQETYLARAREFRAAHNRPYPDDFKAPFYHSPAHPEKEHGEWGSMLREAFSAHL